MKFLLLLITTFSLFSESIVLPLGVEGYVRYTSTDGLINSVERLDIDGEIIYTHSYHYNEDRRLVKEDLIRDLGSIECEGDYSVESPYHNEDLLKDEKGHVICHKSAGKQNLINTIISRSLLQPLAM